MCLDFMYRFLCRKFELNQIDCRHTLLLFLKLHRFFHQLLFVAASFVVFKKGSSFQTRRVLIACQLTNMFSFNCVQRNFVWRL